MSQPGQTIQHQTPIILDDLHRHIQLTGNEITIPLIHVLGARILDWADQPRCGTAACPEFCFGLRHSPATHVMVLRMCKLVTEGASLLKVEHVPVKNDGSYFFEVEAAQSWSQRSFFNVQTKRLCLVEKLRIGCSYRPSPPWLSRDLFSSCNAATWAKYANAPIDTVTHPATSTPPAHVAPVQTTTTPTGDANALATAVIQGLYGNQPQRQKLLGNRYNEIMAIVNRRLSGSSAAPGGSYVVRPGDYLSRIWPSTWPAIAALNGLRPPYTIYAGQTLRTSGGAAASTGRRYTVRSGDTLGAIARRLGVPIGAIHGYRSGNPNLIYVGETIAY